MKFAETLGAHITPTWRKQYIEYEKMKEMLYEAQEGVPIAEGCVFAKVQFEALDLILVGFQNLKSVIKVKGQNGGLIYIKRYSELFDEDGYRYFHKCALETFSS